MIKKSEFTQIDSDIKFYAIRKMHKGKLVATGRTERKTKQKKQKKNKTNKNSEGQRVLQIPWLNKLGWNEGK